MSLLSVRTKVVEKEALFVQGFETLAVPILLGFCRNSSSRDKVAHFTKERAGLAKCKDLPRLMWIDLDVDKSVPIGSMCETLYVYIVCVVCTVCLYVCVYTCMFQYVLL